MIHCSTADKTRPASFISWLAVVKCDHACMSRLTRCHNKKPLCIKYRMALGKLGGRGGFLILGLWGYITSYKGISTNFVLREPSVYQNISDCLFYNQKTCWSQLISLLCPYTIKTLWNCKYAKFYKTKAFFCGNLSTVAHFNSFLKIFECKMIVFFTFEWFIVHYDHFSQQ